MKLENFFNKPIEPPKWLRLLAEEAKGHSYCCPKCNSEPPEHDDYSYIVDEEKYPKIYNHQSYGNDMGSGYDWTEFHKCVKCKTYYWFCNGT